MLRAVDLSFRYANGGTWVLQDVNIDVRRGECVVLSGPSGCGKSTLTKAFNGLIPHFEKGVRAGRVLLEEEDLAEIPMHRLARRLGSVFQNPRAQFFTTTTTDEIAFGCENMGLARRDLIRRVESAFERFGIERLKDRSVFTLSNGERQAVILAAVYAMGVDVFILDEPSANLDPAAIARLRSILGDLKEEGKTLIVAEHRVRYLEALSDRYVIMEQGQIVEDRIGSYPVQRPYARPEQPQSPDDAANRLIVRDLRFRYAKCDRQVLRGVDFEAGSCEVIALVGANGAGKTTLAMILAGLLEETAGTVLVNNKPIAARERTAHCKLVMQDADYQLFTESVYRELELGLDRECDHRDRIMEVLRELDLDRCLNRHPHSLSGGEKQRVAVAAAEVGHPAVLILDEPTSGLDVGNMQRMAEMIRSLAAKGSIVLTITHDIDLVMNCCTRILLLSGGSIELDCGAHSMSGALESFWNSDDSVAQRI